MVLSENEFSVERRVLVDLVRFKSIKRIQRGINPKSVKVLCGTHQLSSLGYLAEESDSKHYLMPIGYRFVYCLSFVEIVSVSVLKIKIKISITILFFYKKKIKCC